MAPDKSGPSNYQMTVCHCLIPNRDKHYSFRFPGAKGPNLVEPRNIVLHAEGKLSQSTGSGRYSRMDGRISSELSNYAGCAVNILVLNHAHCSLITAQQNLRYATSLFEADDRDTQRGGVNRDVW